MKSSLNIFGSCCASFMLCISCSALAEQPVMDEIVVTADYRATSIDDMAASISIIDGDRILRSQAHHLEEVLGMAANVNFSSGASRARFYQVRGIGERGQFAEPLNSSVGLIIDNVDFSGAGNASTLFDVEQVEILKGPQGTLYGANALAGLINIKTREPSSEEEYRLDLGVENFGGTSVGAVMSGPLGSEHLAYRLAGQQYKSDGFNENDHLHAFTNKKDETTLRGKLRWYATSDLQVDVHASYIDLDNGYDVFSLDNARDTLSDEPGRDQQESNIFGGKITWTAPDAWSMELSAGTAKSDINYGYDEDWVFPEFHPWGYSSTDNYLRDRRSTNIELRFVSDQNRPIFNGSTDWVLGVYGINQDANLRRTYTFLEEDFISRHETDRVAVYGQTESRIDADWSLVIGLRYEHYKADYADSYGVGFSPDENLMGGKLVLNYDSPAGPHYYLSISRGYKSGGFNTDGSLDPDLREFDAEELWNYETGVKGKWLDGQLHTQLALFYMDRDNVQISSSVTLERDDGSSEFIDYVGNAAKGSNYGMELEANLAATDSVSLFGSLGLLRSEYKSFINSAGDNLGGRDQAHAPGYQFYVGADWHLTSQLSWRVEVEGKDEFYFSDSHNQLSDPYDLVHMSLRYEADNWHLSLWGRNLTDQDYFVRGYYFGNDPREGYDNKLYTQLGEPLRVGLSFGMDF